MCQFYALKMPLFTSKTLFLLPYLDNISKQWPGQEQKKIDPVKNSAQGEGKARQELAKAAGVSHDTYRKGVEAKPSRLKSVVSHS